MYFKTYSKEHALAQKIKVKAGTFLVTSGTSIFDRIIQFSTLSKWNHAALIIDSKGTIIEVVEQGIRKRSLKQFADNDYHLVDIVMSNQDRLQVKAYAQFMLQKHESYGFMTILSIILQVLTHSRFVIKLDGTLICSEFVAKALSEGGIIWDKDTSLITPADLYNKFVSAGTK